VPPPPPPPPVPPPPPLQLRGSIPLIWTQIPNIKYKPPTKLLQGEASAAAFDAHVDALLHKYGAVSCVNLVNQHGSEGALEAAFAKEAARCGRVRDAGAGPVGGVWGCWLTRAPRHAHRCKVGALSPATPTPMLQVRTLQGPRAALHRL